MIRLALTLALLATPGLVSAHEVAGSTPAMPPSHQHVPGMSHAAHGAAPMAAPSGVTEVGQATFAAVYEIVERLRADPKTDWSRVDVEALRLHLIDMDNLVLRSQVKAVEIPGGARFEATARDPAVIASIRAMVPAHAATMDGVDGWSMTAAEIPDGAALIVTGGNAAQIRALGFIGVMTVGMHHQSHHLALASGQDPHRH